jgi:hypothetical protein
MPAIQPIHPQQENDQKEPIGRHARPALAKFIFTSISFLVILVRAIPLLMRGLLSIRRPNPFQGV